MVRFPTITPWFQKRLENIGRSGHSDYEIHSPSRSNQEGAAFSSTTWAGSPRRSTKALRARITAGLSSSTDPRAIRAFAGLFITIPRLASRAGPLLLPIYAG